MNSKLIKYLGIIFIIFHGLSCFANDPIRSPNLLDLSQPNKNTWTISGLLHNEQDDYYGFMFIVERHHKLYHAYAGIFDLSDKKVLWHHEETIRQDDNNSTPQNIGRFFWQYSAVNDNLIIGCQDVHNKQQIFNLKIDLMEPTVITPKMSLTPTIKLKQYWSGSINGHIHISKEEFVSSQAVWIQNVWQNLADVNPRSFSEILCRFQDGGAMFAIQVPEKNGLHSALAGLYDKEGQRLTISQFINLKTPELPQYSIKLNQNKTELKLNALYANQYYHAFLANINPEEPMGFCLYQKDPWEIFQSNTILFPNAKPVHSLNFFEKTFALIKKPYKIPYILKNKETS